MNLRKYPPDLVVSLSRSLTSYAPTISTALMNLHERVLSVLGCRFVDDVLIDAPYEITEDMLSSLRISEVLESPDTGYETASVNGSLDRFRFVPKESRQPIDNPSNFSLQNILQRIRRNQDKFQARFERKMNVEKQFFQTKHSSGNGQEHVAKE